MPSATASVPPPTRTAATRNLGLLAIAGSVVLALLGLIFTAEDVDQGSSVRIMYVHVPTAWVAYLAFVFTAVCSAGHLWGKKHSLNLDRLAGASAEVGVIFMGVTLVTGSLWGRLSWGTYWQWDPRLTTTAFLFVTYIGYLAVRGLGGTQRQRAKRSASLRSLRFSRFRWFTSASSFGAHSISKQRSCGRTAMSRWMDSCSFR